MWVNILCDCPHCGDYLDRLEEEFKTMQDQEIREVKCVNCGGSFKAEALVSIEITRKYKEEQEWLSGKSVMSQPFDYSKDQDTPQELMQKAQEVVEEAKKHDAVNHPKHYTQGGIECIEAMEAMLTPEEFRGFLRGSIFKYQWRVMDKNGIEDLEKAKWYLDKLIEKLKRMEER